MFYLYRIPAHVAFVLRWNLFIQTLPLEPELCFIISVSRAVINTVKIELPNTAKEGAFDWNAVAHLPAKPFGRGCAGNGSLAVFYKVLPLLFRNVEFGIDPALVVDIN